MKLIDFTKLSPNHKRMRQTLQAVAIPAFEDNYIWLLHDKTQAIVIDPGDDVPIRESLQALRLNLQAILITHHHHDHVDGVAGLLHHFPHAQVFAPDASDDFSYHFAYQAVREQSNLLMPFELNKNRLHFNVLEVPGHTLDHVAYVLNVQDETWLFCGDTLFGAGCGRLFEGSPTQMLDSLKKLCQLPTQTKVFCTHEYTLKNIQFARQLEPENTALIEREKVTKLLREKNLPSLPSTIALELATNPFLRCQTQTIKRAVQAPQATELEVFTKVRTWRNHF